MEYTNKGWEATHKKKQGSKLLLPNPKEVNHKNIKITSKTAGCNNHYSLISLNISGRTSPIKRLRIKHWICKQDPTFCCIQETHLSAKDKHYLRVKGWKTVLQAYVPRQQAGLVILISDQIDFQPKVIKKDTECHFMHIKGKLYQ